MNRDAKNRTLSTSPNNIGEVDSFVGNIQQNITKLFGIAVKTRRQELGITQVELSKMAGLNRSYISEVERGRVSISLERADKVARALNCDLVELLAKG